MSIFSKIVKKIFSPDETGKDDQWTGSDGKPTSTWYEWMGRHQADPDNVPAPPPQPIHPINVDYNQPPDDSNRIA